MERNGANDAGGCWTQTPDSIKTAILADSVAGVSVPELVRKYGKSRRTVQRILANMKRSMPTDCAPNDTVLATKGRITRKAVVALESGLECDADPYKRGNLGVAALRGTGFFALEQQNNLAVILGTVPPDFRDDF